MDMGRILTVFQNMKNVNLDGGAMSQQPLQESSDQNFIDILNSAAGYLADEDHQTARKMIQKAIFYHCGPFGVYPYGERMQKDRNDPITIQLREIQKSISYGRDEESYNKLRKLIDSLSTEQETNSEYEEKIFGESSENSNQNLIDILNSAAGYLADYDNDSAMKRLFHAQAVTPPIHATWIDNIIELIADDEASVAHDLILQLIERLSENEIDQADPIKDYEARQEYEDIKMLNASNREYEEKMFGETCNSDLRKLYDLISETEDEGPTGKYGAGTVWTKDQYHMPEEDYFKNDIAGEKFDDQDINDHALTVDDELEQDHLEESIDDDFKGWVQSFVKDSANKREIPQRRSRMEHEIVWCQDAVKKLEDMLVRKPSKAKEINTLKRQIREKELKLAFDPFYGGEVKDLPIERQMIDKLEESFARMGQKE
jgi:hypothetical protein